MPFNSTRTAAPISAPLPMPSKNRKESFARSVLALLVRESQGISIEELALVLRREPSGLSKLANRLERNCLVSSETALEIEQLRKCLSPLCKCPNVRPDPVMSALADGNGNFASP